MGLLGGSVGRTGVAGGCQSGRGDLVSEQVCADCHGEEAAAWCGSHHDLAMQEPTAATVLGDFGGASFSAIVA